MKQFVMALCILSCSVGALAKDQPVKCNPNGNQMELNQCASDKFAAADAKLNKTWQVLMAAHKHEAKIPDQLKKAQKAWITFRDAEVAAIFACEEGDVQVCHGSMYPLLFSDVMTELTDARTERLQKYIDDGLGVKMGN